MNEKEAKEIIENMSNEELNEYVFFIAQTMTEKYDELKTKIKQLKKKMIADKMEQFDDYTIYLIESYLNILEE